MKNNSAPYILRLLAASALAAIALPVGAQIPPPADAEARAAYERIRPANPKLRLEDFAADDSLSLVRAMSPDFFGSKLLK